MENNLYNFIDDSGSFKSLFAHKIKSLYLPLCNELLMSSVTADLGGDIKSGQNSFLLEPATRTSLSLSKVSRNFWVYVNKDKVWSATGVSKDLKQLRQDEFALEAGQLWQRISRQNNKIGLKSEILSFIPSGPEALEVMQVAITNVSKEKISFIPYAAIPLYARSADNLRDHRQVTSLLTRIKEEKYGIKIKPTLLFDESGHRPNNTVYYVAGCDNQGRGPRYIYPTQEIFCGESGDLEAPEAVFENKLPQAQKTSIQGKEPMGAMRFTKITLPAGAQATYIIIMGIAQGDCDLGSLISKFNHRAKVNPAPRAKARGFTGSGVNTHFEKTKKFWQAQSKLIEVSSGNKHFDNWLRWVSIQPLLRKIFGCSFLPDFDYGKGGRGWRDLWQDCLGLILNNPQAVRPLLINNFCGVKIDGSNATIIGKKSGEFIADRNNISRVWMDHGVWPLITLDLYIQETADLGILFEPAVYFRNHQVNRARGIDHCWSPEYGNRLKTKSGKIYSGTVLEHLLVQNLVQFYNVGAHNHTRLEGADWNDGLDMAKEHGESVAFSSMYAANLLTLSRLLIKAGIKDLAVAQELKILLVDFNYADITRKHRILEQYFSKTKIHLSGKKIRLDASVLSRSLREKSLWMREHIQKSEWLKAGFFNGYYDNRKHRVDGKKGNFVRMTLASQVFPIMSQVASAGQIQKILSNVYRYLYDRRVGGVRLNTDFKKEQHDLGRAFSFAYGEKENGAIFSHMVVMFAHALYKQGYADAGWKALSSLYKIAARTASSKIYPCLPEYFNLQGRGMYPYLTGSASWFMLTLLTQSFGVKGQNGDLLIEPKLSSEQFKPANKISVTRVFAGRRLKIVFLNPNRLEAGKYRIKRFMLNAERISIEENARVVISREVIIGLPKDKLNIIEVHLG
ncbi:MAG: cellobiose phosphorylase [Candidatus Omnitrophica bacterium]|nr:cellobiose phosphorylase [Candidatus Omnitrophota bacterium]